MKIEIENLRLKSYVGIYDHEQTCPQDIIINVMLEFDAAKAAATDDITHAVDYEKISHGIRKILEQNRFNLIETLARRIIDMISADPRILEAEVKVSKPGAIADAEKVSATACFIRASQD